jgi:serine/threonine-protein kinase
MAPEQIRADATIDGRADLFSLGAVLYEMLTGTQPFTGETVSEIMQRVLDAEPPPPSTLNSRVPARLDAIVLRMLAKQPGERFASARSLFRELRHLEERLEERTTREAADEAEAVAAAAGAVVPNDGDKTLVLAAAQPEAARRTSRSMRRVAALVAAGVAVGVVALIPLRFQFSDAKATRTEVAAASPAVVAEPPPAAEPAPPPTAEPPPPPEPAKAAPAPPPKRVAAPRPAPKPPAPRPPRSAAPPPAPPPVQAAVQPARPATPPPPQTAKLLFAVSPWGDVYIDGKRRGTTPPISVLELPPGRHRLEIRNSAKLPYLTDITLQAGASHTVEYTFPN